MDTGQVRQVIKEYRTYLAQSGDDPQQVDHDLAPTRGEALRHLLFMCDPIEKMLDEQHLLDQGTEEDLKMWGKINRWLGFMQGVLWSQGIFTLNDLREHNIRPVSRNSS